MIIRILVCLLLKKLAKTLEISDNLLKSLYFSQLAFFKLCVIDEIKDSENTKKIQYPSPNLSMKYKEVMQSDTVNIDEVIAEIRSAVSKDMRLLSKVRKIPWPS